MSINENDSAVPVAYIYIYTGLAHKQTKNGAITDMCMITFNCVSGVPPWSSGSVLDHISLSPVFESRRGHI